MPNKSIGGGPLRIDGKTYAKGIGAHANAISIYPIPKNATRFVAVVGIDDSQKNDPRSSVVFQVFGNVKEMGEKPAADRQVSGAFRQVAAQLGRSIWN